MKTLTGAAPDDLRHPGPLTRGADRGACGQHERPVEGPAATAADPTAGCGVSGDGYGYADHVGTFLLAKRVLGRLSDPHYKVRRPRGPSRLAKAGRRGHSFLINAGGHCTVPAVIRVPLGYTCRKAQRALTEHQDVIPPYRVREPFGSTNGLLARQVPMIRTEFGPETKRVCTNTPANPARRAATCSSGPPSGKCQRPATRETGVEPDAVSPGGRWAAQAFCLGVTRRTGTSRPASRWGIRAPDVRRRQEGHRGTS